MLLQPSLHLILVIGSSDENIMGLLHMQRKQKYKGK